MSVSRTVGSVPGFYSLTRRCPNGSHQGKGCFRLAQPRQLQSGPAFSGVCLFLQVVHLELLSGIPSSDGSHLHEETVLLVAAGPDCF